MLGADCGAEEEKHLEGGYELETILLCKKSLSNFLEDHAAISLKKSQKPRNKRKFNAIPGQKSSRFSKKVAT